MLARMREKLEKELKALEREYRHELPKEIGRALQMGDLRENAEYQAALERQHYVKARMAWQIPAFRLDDDKFYIIGDNRDMGQRRHDFGICREHEIVGRVLF